MKTAAARKTETFAVKELNGAMSDEQLQAEFDGLMVLASRGDRRAIGAIAIALGPTLLEEARTALEEFDQEAEDVLQDFLLSLLERRLRFDPAQGRATRWMCGVIQVMALYRRRERERDWGKDTEDE